MTWRQAVAWRIVGPWYRWRAVRAFAEIQRRMEAEERWRRVWHG